MLAWRHAWQSGDNVIGPRNRQYKDPIRRVERPMR